MGGGGGGRWEDLWGLKEYRRALLGDQFHFIFAHPKSSNFPPRATIYHNGYFLLLTIFIYFRRKSKNFQRWRGASFTKKMLRAMTNTDQPSIHNGSWVSPDGVAFWAESRVPIAKVNAVISCDTSSQTLRQENIAGTWGRCLESLRR